MGTHQGDTSTERNPRVTGDTSRGDTLTQKSTQRVTSDTPGRGYRRLRGWELADRLAHEVYRVTKEFPREERFGVIAQLRRAAVSVPTNLVEGQARRGTRELKQFASIALGSLAEVEYLLGFAHQEGYMTEAQYRAIEELRQQVGSLLWSFHRAL